MADVIVDRGRRRVVHSESRVPAEIIASRIVYWLFGLIEAIIALRFILALLGANPNAGFTRIIYALSAAPMAPFLAVFPTQQVQGAVFEWSALLAIVVYALIAWGIESLIRAASPRAGVDHYEDSEVVEEEAPPTYVDRTDSGYVEDRRVPRP
jgi:uncharacterized protein YggT (Ycf19 family)